MSRIIKQNKVDKPDKIDISEKKRLSDKICCFLLLTYLSLMLVFMAYDNDKQNIEKNNHLIYSRCVFNYTGTQNDNMRNMDVTATININSVLNFNITRNIDCCMPCIDDIFIKCATIEKNSECFYDNKNDKILFKKYPDRTMICASPLLTMLVVIFLKY